MDFYYSEGMDIPFHDEVEVDNNGQAVCSLDSRQSVDISLQNATRFDVNVFWLDYRGTKKFYTTLGPGDSWLVHTYVTHPWTIFNAETNERLAVAGNQAILFPSRVQHQTYKVTAPPSLQWSINDHHRFPQKFRDTVCLLLLLWYRKSSQPPTEPANAPQQSKPKDVPSFKSSVLRHLQRWTRISQTSSTSSTMPPFRPSCFRSTSPCSHSRASKQSLTEETVHLISALPMDVLLKIVAPIAPPVADFAQIVPPAV